MKKLLLVLALSLIASLAMTGIASAQAAPSFKLGFKHLADLIPDIVGQALENEHYSANGDSIQMTSKGMLVWRKADNWTAFTDGSRTWIFGPYGLQERPNDQRFDWEPRDSGQAPATAAPTPAPASGSVLLSGQVASVNGKTITLNDRGGSINVDVTNATIQKRVSGTAADLANGQTVVVAGRQDSAGNFTASDVDINPVNAAGQPALSGQAPGPRTQGRFLTGAVTAVSGNTVTVQTQQGSTVQVDVSSARIQKTVSGSVADLTAGTTVVVSGQRNSDGSLTASRVEIRSAGILMGRGL